MQKTRQIRAIKVKGLKTLLPQDVSLKTLQEATKLGRRNLRAAKSKVSPAHVKTALRRISAALNSWQAIKANIGGQQCLMRMEPDRRGRGNKIAFLFLTPNKEWEWVSSWKEITRIAEAVGNYLHTNPLYKTKGVTLDINICEKPGKKHRS